MRRLGQSGSPGGVWVVLIRGSSHAIDEALNNTEDEELAEELAKEKIKLDEERRKTAQAAMRLQDERRQYEVCLASAYMKAKS